MRCDCKSYNKPEWGGVDRESMLSAPSWSSKEFICVDACLVGVITALWARGIVTAGCCCGHMGNAMPYVCITNPDRVRDACEVIAGHGRNMQVVVWSDVVCFEQEDSPE